MFFCKGEQAHFAIQSLQAASRNYIRGRLGSAVLEGLVRSIEVRTLAYFQARLRLIAKPVF